MGTWERGHEEENWLGSALGGLTCFCSHRITEPLRLE